MKDDRKRLIDEYEEKIRGREEQLETEKESLVQEISRGKSAAISLMQVSGLDSVRLSLDSLLYLGCDSCSYNLD